MTAYILNHVGYDDPGYTKIALDQLGITWQMRYREYLTSQHRELPGDAELVILLGSLWDPTDTAMPEVKAELSLITKAREAGIPIFGVCYGAQLLALSSGARLYRLSSPNIGYRQVIFDHNWQPPSNQFFGTISALTRLLEPPIWPGVLSRPGHSKKKESWLCSSMQTPRPDCCSAGPAKGQQNWQSLRSICTVSWLTLSVHPQPSSPLHLMPFAAC